MHRGLAHGYRVELCSADGETLKAFSLDECDGGPHEFRGVKRDTLLGALQSIVPESCIEYGAAIHSVETDQNGMYCFVADVAACSACLHITKYTTIVCSKEQCCTPHCLCTRASPHLCVV